MLTLYHSARRLGKDENADIPLHTQMRRRESRPFAALFARGVFFVDFNRNLSK
jgi:hypothetical protein